MKGDDGMTMETEKSARRLAYAMSKAFRDSDGGGIMERFESVSKVLFMALYSKNNPEVLTGIDATPFEKSEGETDRSIYELGRALWVSIVRKTGLGVDGRSYPSDVKGTAEAIRLVRGHDLNSDVLGVAYEDLLKDTFEKNDNQQYFTPRQVVSLMVSMTDLSSVKAVLDPACGSGGFLVRAVKRAAKEGNTSLDAYGIDVDSRMAWLARTNLAAHGADCSHIAHVPRAGSLDDFEAIEYLLPPEGADVIFENPPFGSEVTDKDVLIRFATGREKQSRRRSVLFLERSLDLLSSGGTLAIVLDDSVLNLPGNADVRVLVRKCGAVRAIVSLPDVTFMPYSTAKSSVLLIEKGAEQGPVFMASAKEVGRRPNGDVLYDDAGNVLSDLTEIEAAWESWVNGMLPQSNLCYIAELEDDLGARLDANYYHPSKKRAVKALGSSKWPLKPLDELCDTVRASVSLSTFDPGEPVTWVGLAEIESSTGVYRPVVVRAGSIKSSVHTYREGDILYSRLRPELRKAVVAREDGYCSGELVVLRPKSGVDINTDYLAGVLRSDLTYGQIVYRVTGLGRPRISPKNLRRIMVPVPPPAEQRKAAKRYEGALDSYRKVCEEADSAKVSAYNKLLIAQEPII